MKLGLRRFIASGLTHVAFAFFVMGGWAVLANATHPMPKPVVAGLVQGAMSAGLTLFLKSVIDRLSRSFDGSAARWAPAAIACLASTTLLTAIHALSGTPEILRTIAVPLAVSTSYGAIYNYSVTKREA